MMTKEMKAMVEELVEMFGADGCGHCPYAEQCQGAELYWACPVWEEQMGEDL